MGDDLVNDALRHGVEPGYLTARTSHPHPGNDDPIRQFAQLLIKRSETGARGLHGIAVRPQINGFQYLVIGYSHEDGFCSR